MLATVTQCQDRSQRLAGILPTSAVPVGKLINQNRMNPAKETDSNAATTTPNDMTVDRKPCELHAKELQFLWNFACNSQHATASRDIVEHRAIS